MASLSIFLPGKSHGQRNVWATVDGVEKESDMTRHTYTHYVYNSMHPQCTGDIKLENTQSLQKVKLFLVCVPRVLGIGSHRYINR